MPVERRFTIGMDQRFSDYIAKQQGTAFSQDSLGNQPLDVYTVNDPLAPRYRPTILVPEYGDSTPPSA